MASVSQLGEIESTTDWTVHTTNQLYIAMRIIARPEKLDKTAVAVSHSVNALKERCQEVAHFPLKWKDFLGFETSNSYGTYQEICWFHIREVEYI